jgi:hypothetical protein
MHGILIITLHDESSTSVPPKPPVMEHINAFFKTGDTPNCQYPKSAVANVVTIEHTHTMNKYFIARFIFIFSHRTFLNDSFFKASEARL